MTIVEKGRREPYIRVSTITFQRHGRYATLSFDVSNTREDVVIQTCDIVTIIDHDEIYRTLKRKENADG